MAPEVKICGLRRIADAELSVRLGARWLGCVLAGSSPRCATLDEARSIRTATEGAAELVLVFRDAQPDEVVAACDRVGAHRVQLHATSEPRVRDVERHGLIAHRVVPLGAAAPAATRERPYVIDQPAGGTGRPLDWSRIGDRAPECAFIAGGITPKNVTTLLTHRPWGIDVSSGIERVPGVKSHEAMRALFAHIAEHRATS